MKTGKTGKIIVVPLLVLLLLLGAACAPATTEKKEVTGEQEVTKEKVGEKAIVREEEKPSALPAAGEWGILEVRVTDPGPADVKSAVVYLKNIEVHKVSANATEGSSDNDSGWIPIIGAPPSFDLMDIIGVAQALGSANITAGSFTQIRMDVERVEVVTTDNESFTAQVPSDKLRIVGAFNVGGGRTTGLTLDFDGEKSLIVTGKGQALFKPVVKLLIEVKEAAFDKRPTTRPETTRPEGSENRTVEGKEIPTKGVERKP